MLVRNVSIDGDVRLAVGDAIRIGAYELRVTGLGDAGYDVSLELSAVAQPIRPWGVGVGRLGPKEDGTGVAWRGRLDDACHERGAVRGVGTDRQSVVLGELPPDCERQHGRGGKQWQAERPAPSARGRETRERGKGEEA